jgi:hypothetical protein
MRRGVVVFTMLPMPRYRSPHLSVQETLPKWASAMHAERTRTLYGTTEMVNCIASCQRSR